MEIGYRLGRRHRASGVDEARKSHVGALEAALLGLLALLLGFTFSMAVSRFDTRKSLVLEEANAIGVAHLRTRLIASPEREQFHLLLVDS
ncbi:MAG: hypothetical protein ABW034_05905 [Steroidobacteraceae bacterium]